MRTQCALRELTGTERRAIVRAWSGRESRVLEEMGWEIGLQEWWGHV